MKIFDTNKSQKLNESQSEWKAKIFYTKFEFFLCTNSEVVRQESDEWKSGLLYSNLKEKAIISHQCLQSRDSRRGPAHHYTRLFYLYIVRHKIIMSFEYFLQIFYTKSYEFFCVKISIIYWLNWRWMHWVCDECTHGQSLAVNPSAHRLAKSSKLSQHIYNCSEAYLWDPFSRYKAFGVLLCGEQYHENQVLLSRHWLKNSLCLLMYFSLPFVSRNSLEKFDSSENSVKIENKVIECQLKRGKSQDSNHFTTSSPTKGNLRSNLSILQ